MRRPLAPCPQYQMRGERVARVCRRGDGRRAVQYLAIANRREIVHRFGFRHWLLGGDSLAAQAAASSDYFRGLLRGVSLARPKVRSQGAAGSFLRDIWAGREQQLLVHY